MNLLHSLVGNYFSNLSSYCFIQFIKQNKEMTTPVSKNRIYLESAILIKSSNLSNYDFIRSLYFIPNLL